MPKKSILLYAKQLNRAVFTTRELSMLSGSSLSNTTQVLNLLEKKRIGFQDNQRPVGRNWQQTVKPIHCYSVFTTETPCIRILHKRITSTWHH